MARRAAKEASRVILEVYESGSFDVERKADASPLTLADRRAHDAIVSILESKGHPILSEEGKSISWETRKKWSRFWMVDPLDGTREFLRRNGEFTVNIALIENTEAVLGVVTVPVANLEYYAAKGEGSHRSHNGTLTVLARRTKVPLNKPGIRVIASRSHLDEDTRRFMSSLNEPSVLSAGSSLKFLKVAEGEADVYPRFAPTMEWDTAAAHAILRETGHGIYHNNSEVELSYNKPDLHNPFFICR